MVTQGFHPFHKNGVDIVDNEDVIFQRHGNYIKM